MSENQGLWTHDIASAFRPDADAVIAPGDSLETLRGLPDGLAKLIISIGAMSYGKCCQTRISPSLERALRRTTQAWMVETLGELFAQGTVFIIDSLPLPV